MTVEPRPVTWLYVPATRPELLAKALRSSTDAVIVDLEDAVAPRAKDIARRTVLDALAELGGHAPLQHRPAIQIRVNPVRTELGQRDLTAIAGHSTLAAVRLPKVECPEDVVLATELLGGDIAPGIHCLIESAAGVERAAETAATPGVSGISLGEADLIAELRLADEHGLAWARGRIVVAAAAAGLPPPSMSVFADLDDDVGLAASCRRGRALGFWGRAAIHPRQLPVIRATFAPSETEIEKAKEVLAAAGRADANGVGAVRLPDGRFVDRAVVLAARRSVQTHTPTSTAPAGDDVEEGR